MNMYQKLVYFTNVGKQIMQLFSLVFFKGSQIFLIKAQFKIE